jgi:hypothetical protein
VLQCRWQACAELACGTLCALTRSARRQTPTTTEYRAGCVRIDPERLCIACILSAVQCARPVDEWRPRRAIMWCLCRVCVSVVSCSETGSLDQPSSREPGCPSRVREFSHHLTLIYFLFCVLFTGPTLERQHASTPVDHTAHKTQHTPDKCFVMYRCKRFYPKRRISLGSQIVDIVGNTMRSGVYLG